MRYLPFLFVLIPASAQQSPRSQTDVYTYDANGGRVLASQQVAGTGSAEQRARNMNGRVAPLEQVEEKVISDDANGRVVEKLVRGTDDPCAETVSLIGYAVLVDLAPALEKSY